MPDYEAGFPDLMGPAYIAFGSTGGAFSFGCVTGAFAGGSDHDAVQFDWDGNDEMDEACGHGCQFLADGGIPAIINGASSCSGLTGNLTTVIIAHVWVSALGNLYDPSFKHHVFKSGIDYAAAMGCGTMAAPTCASTISTATLIGATVSTPTFGGITANSIANANEAGVESQMTTYATSGVDGRASLEFRSRH